MEDQNKMTQIPTVKLGSQGLEVSKLGFGCAGLSGAYNSPVSDEDGISIIKHAFISGITFFDTSDSYGLHTNEILIGKVSLNWMHFYFYFDHCLETIAKREDTTGYKFGIAPQSGGMVVNGKPEYVRASCNASLERLRVDYIDLYYQHRVDQATPIEETIGELKKLAEEGKVKYIGLSEASSNTIRLAHAVHPISAVQMEWSLWSRDIEEEIVPLYRELGIGIVPYSPLGRGFYGGRAILDSVPANSVLASHPRFTGENLEKNKALYSQAEKLALKHHCTPAQLALAWVLHHGDDVVPIPGTTKIKNLNDNIGTMKVRLSTDDVKEISVTISAEHVAGMRSFNFSESFDWKYANTPPRGGNVSMYRHNCANFLILSSHCPLPFKKF